MRYRLPILAASLLCLTVVVVPAAQAAAPPSGAPSHAANLSLCDNYAPSRLCIRDPSDGGPGTTALMDTYGGQHAMDWTAQPSPFCGGRVQNGCGFPTSIVMRYPDHRIRQFALENTTDCLAANSVTHNVLQIRSCGNLDSAFIEGSCSQGYCFVVSGYIAATMANTYWMCGNAAVGHPLVVSPCGVTGLAQWKYVS